MLRVLKPIFVLTLLALAVNPAWAKSKLFSDKASNENRNSGRYIVTLREPALMHYTGQPDQLTANTFSGKQPRLAATSPKVTGERKFDAHSPQAKAYTDYLDQRFASIKADMEFELGRVITPVHRYWVIRNGFSAYFSTEEANHLRSLPEVVSVEPVITYKLQTDAGPTWIGAPEVWSGAAGVQSRGEGIVVGIIDSGVNWAHPSFADISGDGFDHVNPRGATLGLCSDPEVLCNDKLIGVYDFVSGTGNEENTKGRDNDGHGSHTGSTAAGNVVAIVPGGTTISGVAPRANVITYRVCFIGDPDDPDDDGCDGDAIIDAQQQAILDNVDVVNYSIGSPSPRDPWTTNSSQGFLDMRTAGIVAITSGGNDGPGDATIGSPTNSPWLMAVAAARHNRVGFLNTLEGLAGGSSTPPPDLTGRGLSGSTVHLEIVHAKDFGNALCGTGTAELQSSCDAHTGSTNPWAGDTTLFENKIVVCDRGTYGRIEKGFNVQAAGAAGYILANTSASGEQVSEDAHCLPGVHLGQQAGDMLRAWLDNGTGHTGRISGVQQELNNANGDILASFSSRGPSTGVTENILKPDVMAPGVSILAAVAEPDAGLGFLSGTSMASPHVAGLAALLRATHPDWTVSQVYSAIATTATDALAKDFNGSPVTPHKIGSGRVQAGEAAQAGLFLDATTAQFNAANPASGGQPETLNLPSLTNWKCRGGCTFTRTVTDMIGGATWNAAVEGALPAGMTVSVSPDNFTLGNGASQQLTVTVDVQDVSNLTSTAQYGKLRLTSSSAPDAVLPLSLFFTGGELPFRWTIATNSDRGQQSFQLADLIELPDATVTTGGLARPTRINYQLMTDPDNTPFGGGVGVETRLVDVPEGTSLIRFELPGSGISTRDADLYVGIDANGNNVADNTTAERLCTSFTPGDAEECEITNPEPGRYWVLTQMFCGEYDTGGNCIDDGTQAFDVELVEVIVSPSDDAGFSAMAKGITAENESFTVDIAWDNASIVPGETWFGFVGIGTDKDHPGNIGIIPVELRRTTSTQMPENRLLVNNREHSFSMPGNSTFEQLYVDVPPGTDTLDITLQPRFEVQSMNVTSELHRVPFDNAFGRVPFADDIPGGSTPLTTAQSSDNSPNVLSLSGGVQPGRYQVRVMTTGAASAYQIDAIAQMTSSTARMQPHRGLWGNLRNVGMEYAEIGNVGFVAMYTYDEDGEPTWYIGQAPIDANSNVWTSDLLRFTGKNVSQGVDQKFSVVGNMSLTFIGDRDMILSYDLLGTSGSDRMTALTSTNCLNGSSYTGLWAGDNGVSTLAIPATEFYAHYFYDATGSPRWVVAQGDNGPLSSTTVPVLQFKGYCPTCNVSAVTSSEVGTFNRTFMSETSAMWTQNFSLTGSLSHTSVNRTDDAVKLSDRYSCN